MNLVVSPPLSLLPLVTSSCKALILTQYFCNSKCWIGGVCGGERKGGLFSFIFFWGDNCFMLYTNPHVVTTTPVTRNPERRRLGVMEN